MLAVWAGAIGGVALAIVIGIIFIVIFYVAQQTVFQGSGKNIFTGVLMLIASFMITFLAFAMLKIRGYEEKWQAKLEGAASQMVCSVSPPMHVRQCIHCHNKLCATPGSPLWQFSEPHALCIWA